jgi:hypothetical protein
MTVLSKLVMGASGIAALTIRPAHEKQPTVLDAALKLKTSVSKKSSAKSLLKKGDDEEESHEYWHVRDVTCIVGAFGGTCPYDEFCYVNLAAKIEDSGACVPKMSPGGECGMFDKVYHGHMCLDGESHNGGFQKFSCQVPEGAEQVDEAEIAEQTYGEGLQQGKCQPCCDTFTYTTDDLKEIGCKTPESEKFFPDCPLPVWPDADEDHVEPGPPMDVTHPNTVTIIESDTTVCVGPFHAGDKVECPGGKFVEVAAGAPEACITIEEFAPGLVHKPMPDDDHENSEQLYGDMQAAAAANAGLCKPAKKEKAPKEKKETPAKEEKPPKETNKPEAPAAPAPSVADTKVDAVPQTEEIKESLNPSAAQDAKQKALDTAPVPE